MDKLEKIRHLCKLQRIDQTVDAQLNQLVNNDDLDQELNEKFIVYYKESILPELKRDMEELYLVNYSESNIDAMIAFYSSVDGQKLLDTQYAMAVMQQNIMRKYVEKTFEWVSENAI